MIERRPHAELGHARHGWLNARHHFSFAEYHDAQRMRWAGCVSGTTTASPRIRASSPTGIATWKSSPTCARARSLTNSLGNRGRTVAGDVQVMSAGSGIVHSEYNLEDEETRIFQIWIHPQQTGLPPTWGTRRFPSGERAGRSSPWPAACRATTRPCRFVPRPVWQRLRLNRGRAPITRSPKGAASTWCPRAGRSRSTVSPSPPGMAWPCAMRHG